MSKNEQATDSSCYLTSTLEHDAFYLMACALHGLAADEKHASNMDLVQLLNWAQKRSVAALLAAPLLELWRSGSQIPECAQAWKKADASAAFRCAQSEYAQEQLCAWLENEGVWYVLLKGSVLERYYPNPHLHERCDIDILFDTSQREHLHKHMEQLGYTHKHFEHHDIYTKAPVLNFEMHLGLADRDADSRVAAYCKKIEQRLLPVENKVYEKRLSDTDFYIFMIIHAAKHMREGGIGVRELINCYVTDTAFASALDYNLIDAELDKLGFKDFAQNLRSLARKLFGRPGNLEELSGGETELLSTILKTATYANLEARVEHRLGELQQRTGNSHKAKFIYIVHRAFPPYENMSRYNEKLRAQPWTLPYYWTRRIVRKLAQKGRWSELTQILKS